MITKTLTKSEWGIVRVALGLTEARLEHMLGGIELEAQKQVAETARDNCPISKLLKPGLEQVTIEAKLKS